MLLCLAGCGRGASAPDLPHAPSALSERFYAPRGWTWSTIRLSNGVSLRYGVASPPVVPHGQVLILPDLNEPAEVWFETANELLDHGYTVWLLEGGGGKGAAALDPANGALPVMVGQVIRPKPEQGVVLVGQGLGSTLALRALGERPVGGIKGAVLASPTLELAGIDLDMPPEQVRSAAEWASRARVGWLPLPGDGQPRLARVQLIYLEPRRAGLAAAWRRADPSLKPHTTTFGWVWVYDQAILAARAPSSTSASTATVVMAAGASDERAATACHKLTGCTLWAEPSSAPHLAPDAVRREWMSRIVGLVERR